MNPLFPHESRMKKRQYAVNVCPRARKITPSVVQCSVTGGSDLLLLLVYRSSAIVIHYPVSAVFQFSLVRG